MNEDRAGWFGSVTPLPCGVCGVTHFVRVPSHCAQCGRLMCRDCASEVSRGEALHGGRYHSVAVRVLTRCKDCRAVDG